MKTNQNYHDDEMLYPPDVDLTPKSPDEVYDDILYPTSPPIERPDPDSDEILLPPLMDK